MLTDCPPGPLERYTSIWRSSGLISTSTSSASGITAIVAVDVWIRPCDSVTGTRCTRCTPASCFSRRERVAPPHLDRHLLEPAEVRRRGREDVGLPPMPLGEPPVHLVEVAGPQRRLLSPRAGADLDDHILAVVRVARRQQVLELGLQRVRPLLRAFGFGEEERRHLGVGLVLREGARLLGLGDGGSVVAIRTDDVLELGEPLAERPHPFGIGGDVGRGHLRGDLVVRDLDLRELRLEPGLHGRDCLRAALRRSRPRLAGQPEPGSSSKFTSRVARSGRSTAVSVEAHRSS